ncbi:MAG: hypothetical protein WBM86_15195, partial [Waterburya sp.]
MKSFNWKFRKSDRATVQRTACQKSGNYPSDSKVMLALMSLSASVLLTSCQGGDSTGSGGLKLGTLTPTTGDLSSIGQN